MIITNTDSVPNREVTEILGVVRGNSVRAKHIGRDLMAGLKGIVGGEISGYTELLADSREEAYKRMTENAESLGKLFTDGVIVSIFNPKIALFFIAFLPQFVHPDAASLSLQIMLLGLLYVTMALVTDSAYVFLSGYLRHWLGSRVIDGPLTQYASGITFLGLGVATSLADRR